ncbi:MAG: aminodeoxychorismate synthase component I [Verrucomicrobiota bacterium]|nr:aminodeoxychorismate synthase component I [Verrucomicrobiota bacterium]
MTFHTNNEVICRLPESQKCWGHFTSPVETVSTANSRELPQILGWLQRSLDNGFYVAGFISYEASTVFDSAYSVKSCPDFPLIWFSAFSSPPTTVDFTNPSEISFPALKMNTSFAQYEKSIKKIKKYIYDGDIYQTNFSFRAHTLTEIPGKNLFINLMNNHPVPYGAFVDTGKFQIISVSPELFLESKDSTLYSLPMKGTAPRNNNPEIDKKIPDKLSSDSKNRAENLMILDMVRNDLGKICIPGTISVDPLFRVDKYNTVYQMVSGVTGKCPANTPIYDILAATFPAASITGAPKIRAMEIINELESSARKTYTGSIGCFYPNGDFCLNVAIRTLLMTENSCEIGIGSAIVADSDSQKEWEECLLKKDFFK